MIAVRCVIGLDPWHMRMLVLQDPVEVRILVITVVHVIYHQRGSFLASVAKKKRKKALQKTMLVYIVARGSLLIYHGFKFPLNPSSMRFERLRVRTLSTQSSHTPDQTSQRVIQYASVRARRRDHHTFRTISAPGPRFATLTLLPNSCLSIFRTSSFVYFLVFTDITESPVLSLSSSCALIQHLAIRFCAISIPPGKPAATLPPRYQGFSTRSKECSRSVRGRAAIDTRWVEA